MNKLATFKQSIELKILGFPQEIEHYSARYITKKAVSFQNSYEGYPYTYNVSEVVWLTEETADGSYEIGDQVEDNYIMAPTLDMVTSWFRDEKNIHLICPRIRNDAKGWQFLYAFNGNKLVEWFDTFEEAQSAGINKIIEFLNNENEHQV